VIASPIGLSSIRVIVLGHIVRGPVGGMAWHHLQFVLGLARLGHDVHFFEDSQDYPACYDPSTGRVGTDPTYGLEFTRALFDRVGLGDRWTYYDAHRAVWHGPGADRAVDVCRDADVLLHMSGKSPLRPWHSEIPIRALIDTDPAFTQIRHLTDPDALSRARAHNVFLSFGENIAKPSSRIPDDGLPWRTTRQPIVRDCWPVAPAPADGRLTTVMLWDSYPAREHAGVRYGMKSASFEKLFDLPATAALPLELAVGGPGVPKDRLREAGWTVVDPLEVTRTPSDYQRYLRESKGEFSVAKHGYVVSNSGWFSERSAAYLASGRPVIVEDTGHSDWLNVDAGVLSYRNAAEALDAIDEVHRRYATHARAAREIAEAWFDSDKVLARLLADLETARRGPKVIA